MTSEKIQNPQIYTIGSFENDGWRDLMINRLRNFNFNDPRNHKQSSIARLDYEDMNAAMNSDIALVYLHSGRRAGTMSYSELGGARAKGRCIIAVDKNEEKDSLIKKIASHYYSTEDGVIDLIENKKYFSKYPSIKAVDKTKSKDKYRNILFAGDLTSMDSLINDMAKIKNIYLGKTLSPLVNFSDKIDLIIVNFDEGRLHDTYGLFYMGIGYATETPILELEGNTIPYPPLMGLARRVLIGPKRFDYAKDYLTHLESQHIDDEALIYYQLMKKYNFTSNI